MAPHQSEQQVVELLDLCIHQSRQLVALVAEQHKQGLHSTEGLKCLTDALASLCRCQDYFKNDGDY